MELTTLTSIDFMFDDYRKTRKAIEVAYDEISKHKEGLYYLRESQGRCSDMCKNGAITILNKEMWDKLLTQTNMRSIMPVDDWRTLEKQLEKAPDFTPENVLPTFKYFSSNSQQLFATKVDGVFRRLSPAHRTNKTYGYTEKLIFNCGSPQYGSLHLYPTHCEYLDDLRNVISMVVGAKNLILRDTSYNLLTTLSRGHTGKYINLDGGALRIKLFKKGTVHVEIHEDIAWQLNKHLAFLYPAQIPQNAQTKPVKKNEPELRNTYLDDRTRSIIMCANGDMSKVDYSDLQENGLRNAIIACGGTIEKGKVYFDYDARSVLLTAAIDGYIPEQQAYQFYRTPSHIAENAVEYLEIESTDKILEPSAGDGAIAQYLPIEQTTCYEISKLRCEALKVRGYNVICDSFLNCASKYDKIIMNPPFNKNQWKTHLEHAMQCLNDYGIIVAILPMTAKGYDIAKGYSVELVGQHDNSFAGCGVNVGIFVIRKGV